MTDPPDIGSEPTAAYDVDVRNAVPLGPPDVVANRYVVRAVLGVGGMGSVLRVYDRELDEDVALKVLHPALAVDATSLARFRREVKLARRVTHPNVARTYDLGCDRVWFITMELVEGEAVSALVRDGARPPLPEALRIAEETARGLSAAHAVGVVHRDLKPDNIMRGRGPNGRVVITDFGIARFAELAGATDEPPVSLPRGQPIGTPSYMAPEQMTDQPVDGRTDVYAFGTLLFELLTGQLPFVRKTLMATVAARLTEEASDRVAGQIASPVRSRRRSDLRRGACLRLSHLRRSGSRRWR